MPHILNLFGIEQGDGQILTSTCPGANNSKSGGKGKKPMLKNRINGKAELVTSFCFCTLPHGSYRNSNCSLFHQISFTAEKKSNHASERYP